MKSTLSAMRAMALAALLSLAGCASWFTPPEIKEEPPEDAAVAMRVKAKLIGERDLDAAAIKVESNQGRVRLSGFVDSEQQRRRAGALAQAVAGVQGVDNAIEIK